jgi:hypothetical protein
MVGLVTNHLSYIKWLVTTPTIGNGLMQFSMLIQCPVLVHCGIHYQRIKSHILTKIRFFLHPQIVKFRSLY